MRRLTLHALALSALLLGTLPVQAADTSPPPLPEGLRQAQAQIDQKNWSAAAETLNNFTRSNPKNADGYNLLGYSYRHLQRYDESLDAYERALALNPKHRGAHEYIGETYLALGRLDKAKEHLDVLDRLCFLPCEEYSDLKKAYEAALKAK